MKNEIIELRFTGDISPDRISIRELTDMLVNFEDSVIELILRDHPEVSTEEIIVGLVKIGEGSARFIFRSTFMKYAIPVFILWASSIANNEYKNLPHKSIEASIKIASFAKSRNCIVEFRTGEQSEDVLAKITPETEIIIPESVYLHGETVIYGRIERVGGVKPIVTVRLDDNKLLHCRLSEQKAKNLAPKLYDYVGIKGTAKWNVENYQIEHFEIDRLTEYQQMPISKAVNELAKEFGKYFDAIDDVNKHVSDIRGDLE